MSASAAVLKAVKDDARATLPARAKPIYVEVTGDGGKDYLREAIGKQIELGNMPPFLQESSRLIAPGETAEADIVIKYIQGVLDKLSLASTKKPCPELKIFLSDQQGVNTGVITSAKTPFLTVGLGLIDLLIAHGFGEDHLAAVLGHERFHLRRHEKWKDLNNGRPEETVGDIYGVMEAERAGYNPQALGDLFRVIRDAEAKRRQGEWRGSTLGEFLDEHPDLDTRIRNTELALANLQLTRRMTDKQTDIPGEVLEAAAAVRFRTNFERYMQHTGYAHASPAEKTVLIARYFNQELARKAPYMNEVHEINLRHGGQDPYLMNLHLFEAREALRALRGLGGVQEVAYKQFCALALRGGQYHGKQYAWAMRHLVQLMSPLKYEEPTKEEAWLSSREEIDFDHRVKPAEVIPLIFQRMKADTEAFWNARTREDAIRAAKRYQVSRTSLSRYRGAINVFEFGPVTKNLPYKHDIEREIKEKGHYRFPWENHLQWASGKGETSAADKTDSALIKETALSLGAHDDRRFSGADHEIFYADNIGWTYERLVFDQNGNVTAINPSAKELEEKLKAESRKRFKCQTIAELFEREYALQEKREERELALVPQTDWSGMERNFWEFVEKNAEHLEPSITLVPGRFPFAEEFMKRFTALMEGDEAQWGGTYNTFLTGIGPLTSKSGYYYNDRPETRAFSMPDLIKRVQDRYLGYNDRGILAQRGALPEDHPMCKRLAALHDRREPEIKHRFNATSGHYEEYKVYPEKVSPDQHIVGIALRIDRKHPYVKPLLDLDRTRLSPLRKAHIIGKFDYCDSEANTMEEYFRISPRRVYGYRSINTPARFKQIEASGRESLGLDPIWYGAFGIEVIRTLRRYDGMDPPRRLSISGFDFLAITHTFDQFRNPRLARSLNVELRRLVNRQLQRNKLIDFSDSTPLQVLIKRYLEDRGEPFSKNIYGSKDHHHNIFSTRPELDQAYQAHIRQRIMTLPAAERVQPLSLLMALELRDPGYRRWSVDTWVEAATTKLGKDDGSEAYADRTLVFIQDSVRQINSAQGMNCMIRLLESIEAQRKVALNTKEILSDTFGKRFLEQDGAMRAIESAVITCSHDPVLRAAFLKYITEPLTPEGTQEFAKLLKQRAKPEGYERETSFVGRFFNPKARISMSPQQENIIVDHLHQNFWAMPFGLRTIYLDRILFPVRDTDEDNFQKACTYVLDKVLPDERKYARESREALLVYLDCCPPELRRTTFSAILATTERAAETGELRPGEVLSQVLTRTGAAGGQLLQAAHSYLNGVEITDPDLLQFRDDLVSSKDDFDRPFRWDIFERMDEVLPKDEIGKDRTGRLLGSGSTAYVVEYGSDALKLMRKDVVSIADLQFERFLKSFELLAERHDRYKPLPAMVHHAKQLIQVSTSGVIGGKQLQYAQGCYDSLTIDVNGERHTFHVAGLISAGQEYLRMECIEGQNINEIHKHSRSGVDIKSISIAIETAFIYRLLQGKSMDQDMHGGQQGIVDRAIGMFDTGAIPYDLKNDRISEPTTGEKRALGRLLGITLNAVMADESPVETLVDAVTTREWGGAKQYIVGIKRGLLARSDIHAGFGVSAAERSAVYQDIFRTAWKAGHIDPVIFRGIVDIVDLSTCRKLAIFSVTDSKPQVQISIHEDGTDPGPILTVSQMAKAITSAALRRAFSFAGLGGETSKAAAAKAGPEHAPKRTMG